MLLRLETMTKQREDKMNRLWQTLQSVLRDYSAQTEEKYSEYVELRERDNADTKHIHQNYMEIARLMGEIGQLKAVLEAGKLEDNIHTDQLSDYKRLLQERQAALKRTMDAGQKTDKEQMLQLVVCGTQANAVISSCKHHIVEFICLFEFLCLLEIGQVGGERKNHNSTVRNLCEIGNGA